MAQLGRIDKMVSAFSEARAKLFAAVVRHGCDFHEHATDPDAAAGGKVRVGKIKREVKVVAGQLERLPVGDQLRHVGLHGRELGLEFSFRISSPRITRHAAVDFQSHGLQQFTSAPFSTRHEQCHRAAVLWRPGQGVEESLKIFKRPKTSRISDRIRTDDWSVLVHRRDAACGFEASSVKRTISASARCPIRRRRVCGSLRRFGWSNA